MIHTPDMRWADPGAYTTCELSCSCGEFAVEFKPASQPGQALPFSLALEQFRAHREEKTNSDLGGSPGDRPGS